MSQPLPIHVLDGWPNLKPIYPFPRVVQASTQSQTIRLYYSKSSLDRMSQVIKLVTLLIGLLGRLLCLSVEQLGFPKLPPCPGQQITSPALSTMQEPISDFSQVCEVIYNWVSLICSMLHFLTTRLSNSEFFPVKYKTFIPVKSKQFFLSKTENICQN